MSNKLFQTLNVVNKPSRNGFSLSHRVNFTNKVGELLPIAHFDTMPGDDWSIEIDSFSRTSPADTDAAVQIREYFDVFFVPYRLLWKNAPAVHTQNTRNPVVATSPTSNLPVGSQTPCTSIRSLRENSTSGTILHKLGQYTNAFGYNRGMMANKLLNYLGYGYMDDEYAVKACSGQPLPSRHYSGPDLVSLYPLLSYQCIYYNFYRNSQWQDNQPYNYNVDYLSQDADVHFATGDSSWSEYWSNPTLFDLQYADYPKDLFFGFFPDTQYGDESTVKIDNDGTTIGSGYVTTNNGNQVFAQTQVANTSYLRQNTATGSPSTGTLMTSTPSSVINLDASFGILALRKAQFVQKYREIRGSGNQTYANLVRDTFGVDIPDALDTVPLYLGGHTSIIEFSEVVNTNLADGNSADIAGKGTGGSKSRRIRFKPKEHGCIMVIYHSQPVVDYALNSLHFDVVRTEADDFANPIFDKLGYQEIPTYFLDSTLNVSTNPTSSIGGTLGYTTRYFDYKTAVDRTLGDFRETRKTWLAPVNFDYLSNYLDSTKNLVINYNFFKINPGILDSIFSLKATPVSDASGNFKVDQIANRVSSDQIMVFANFNIGVVRPLDRDGLPY